ncbi:DUF3971 domain-containing protein [Helicobacter sp. 11S02596-1]|uniref:DUF3971 domain-containing protein n=1 Tax=Helicobacter sp. 11S02596-1 TaxID=1476194 RepID=UPI000BA73872|nr:DUF3971 domain-containing protein [Helicobacter sp. 11S02596-1]PAF45132.1 hypothetical protein BJI48_00765 [Helicobacter sp. 11S02596-1]
MSKIVSKKILSLIIFFVIIITLLFAGYKVLSDGFSIQHLKIGKINIDALYLKLDNKLILDIGKLDVSAYLKADTQQPLDIEAFTENIKYGIWAVSYFQRLSIKKIVLDENREASVIYDGKQYQLKFPNIQADFAIENDGKDIHLKILNLIFKNASIQTDGNIIYSTQTRKLGFNLAISPLQSKNAVLYLQGITNLKTLELKAKTSEIKDIAFLQPFFEKIDEPELQEWIFEKIKFSSLQIFATKIQATLTKRHFLATLIKNANIQMRLKNPEIYLDNNLEPIRAKQANLKLENQKVAIGLQNPVYGDTDLDGSALSVSNLLESPKLDIKIISKQARYTQAIKNLLGVYGITLPLEAIESPLDTNINLSIQFLQDSEPIFSAKGLISSQENHFLLYDIPLDIQNANVSLDITPESKYVYINTIHTRYQNIADIDTNITLNLQDKNLQASTAIHKLQISTNNDINTQPYQAPIVAKESQEQNEQKDQEHQEDTQKTPADKETPTNEETSIDKEVPNEIPTNQTAQANQNDQKLPAQTPQNPESLKRKIIEAIKAESQKKFTKDIFYADSQNLPTLALDVDFSNPESVILDIPEFDIEAKMDDDFYTFNAKDLSKFAPYSPLMQYLAIKNGNLQIATHRFENIDFEVQLSGLNLPLYQKDGSQLDKIAISGNINNDVITASSPSQDITLNIKDNQTNIAFKNLDFNLDEFLKSDIPAIKEMLAPSKLKLTQKQIEEETHFIREKQRYERLHNIKPQITTIDSDNTTITYKGYQIPLENINARIRDGRFGADGTYKNGVANLDIAHQNILIKANNFSGDFVNKILKKNMIRGGLYTLIGAYRDDIFNGELKLQNTLFKDFALLQNIINLIDTVPSLIVFKNPNIGIDGYEIQKGSITFAINSKYIGFEHINLIGQSMDIDGNGIIELGSDEINMNLTISTIKNLSNIINKIPVVGYLILGDEGKISTNIIVNGTLEKPKTEITLAEDTIKAPFNILRRVFTPIDIIVDEIKNEMKKN